MSLYVNNRMIVTITMQDGSRIYINSYIISCMYY